MLLFQVNLFQNSLFTATSYGFSYKVQAHTVYSIDLLELEIEKNQIFFERNKSPL